jgi:ABC-type multidrug transport system ATPase subunit/ABC-type transporter Mla maintaining outer membrane lipid asymmetry permease subunit MlaE
MNDGQGLSGTAAPAAIRLSGLTVRAGERTLLENASACLAANQITLIVGPSGVGKSVLLKIICGLIDRQHPAIRYEGEIQVGDGLRKTGQIGVVFQSFALFDELTPRANVKFAKDLGGSRSGSIDVDGMLQELRVPTNVPTSQLSGGQRQRLAIARTLAFNPPAILYDEPTSGLDPATGAQVAQLIRETHRSHGKTSVIVTHDYEKLLPIADHVYVLDPRSRQLTEVPRDQWSRLPEILQPMAAAAIQASEQVQWDWRGFAKRQSLEFLQSTTRTIEAAGVGVISLVPTWRNPKWGLRYLAHYLRLVVGATAWFYLGIAGFIVGFVTTFFVFRYLPYATYIEPILIDDLLAALGFATYRIFVPVLATVLIAARCGAAVSSDVGSKQYGNQVDALQSLGAAPRSYLLTPILISFIVGTPVLTLFAFLVAQALSLVAFVGTHPEHGPDYWFLNYHFLLNKTTGPFFRGTGWLLAKLVLCGAGTAVVAYFQARRPKYSSHDVSASVTATIFWATIYVLIVHFVFAFYEFDPADVN